MDLTWNYYLGYNYLKHFWSETIVDRLNRHGIHILQFSDERITRYAGKAIISKNETNKKIFNMIMSEEPFLVSRLGGVEAEYLTSCLGMSKKHKAKALDMMCSNAGFFPHDMALCDEFVELYAKCVGQMDLCGIWRYFMEDYLLYKYAPDTKLTILEFLEPWRVANGGRPWSSALQGKKVLVVHPFAESIEHQYYTNRIKIWKNKECNGEILPEFSLQTIKAVQSMGGNGAIGYSTWFDALDGMTDQVESKDFDIAIVGCGAYGLPLATRIKQMGRQVIHLAGATQLMFGIMGNRWEKVPEIKNNVNQYWVRPDKSETPECAATIENKCYW